MLKLKYTREILKKDNFQIYSYMGRNFKFIGLRGYTLVNNTNLK